VNSTTAQNVLRLRIISRRQSCIVENSIRTAVVADTTQTNSLVGSKRLNLLRELDDDAVIWLECQYEQAATVLVARGRTADTL